MPHVVFQLTNHFFFPKRCAPNAVAAPAPTSAPPAEARPLFPVAKPKIFKPAPTAIFPTPTLKLAKYTSFSDYYQIMKTGCS